MPPEKTPDESEKFAKSVKEAMKVLVKANEMGISEEEQKSIIRETRGKLEGFIDDFSSEKFRSFINEAIEIVAEDQIEGATSEWTEKVITLAMDKLMSAFDLDDANENLSKGQGVGDEKIYGGDFEENLKKVRKFTGKIR